MLSRVLHTGVAVENVDKAVAMYESLVVVTKSRRRSNYSLKGAIQDII